MAKAINVFQRRVIGGGTENSFRGRFTKDTPLGFFSRSSVGDYAVFGGESATVGGIYFSAGDICECIAGVGVVSSDLTSSFRNILSTSLSTTEVGEYSILRIPYKRQFFINGAMSIDGVVENDGEIIFI